MWGALRPDELCGWAFCWSRAAPSRGLGPSGSRLTRHTQEDAISTQSRGPAIHTRTHAHDRRPPTVVLIPNRRPRDRLSSLEPYGSEASSNFHPPPTLIKRTPSLPLPIGSRHHKKKLSSSHQTMLCLPAIGCPLPPLHLLCIRDSARST